MKFEYRIPLFVLLGSAALIYAVFLVPPLTGSRGSQSTDTAGEAAFKATVRAELAYCEENDVDVNCRCFARTSGTIMSHDTPHVPGAFYADKRELARGQAVEGC